MFRSTHPLTYRMLKTFILPYKCTPYNLYAQSSSPRQHNTPLPSKCTRCARKTPAGLMVCTANSDGKENPEWKISERLVWFIHKMHAPSRTNMPLTQCSIRKALLWWLRVVDFNGIIFFRVSRGYYSPHVAFNGWGNQLPMGASLPTGITAVCKQRFPR